MVIRYAKEAVKFLNKLEKKSVERIKKAIEGLTQTLQRVILSPCRGAKMAE